MEIQNSKMGKLLSLEDTQLIEEALELGVVLTPEIKAKLLAGELAIPVQRSLDGGNLPLFDKEVRKYRLNKHLS